MPSRRLNLQILRFNWILEENLLLILGIDVRQELARLSNIVKDLIPNDVVLRVEHVVRLYPAILATFRYNSSQLATVEKVELKEKKIFKFNFK